MWIWLRKSRFQVPGGERIPAAAPLASVLNEGRKGKFVAIGWTGIGDLRWLGESKSSIDRVSEELAERYQKAFGPDLSRSQIVVGTGQLIRFVRDMKKDDIVIVPDS